MKRGLPFFSPLSVLFTVLILSILVAGIWIQGGLAFNPGPVTAKSQPGLTLGGFSSHADFEGKCSACHQPLRSNQATLCVACHTDIGDQMAAHTNLHGQLANAADCASCHSEHQGRNFDPTHQALVSFDHNQTRFPLTGKHAQLQCIDCHMDGKFVNTPIECAACHTEPAQHAGMFADTCQDCHSTQAWKPAEVNGKPFNHETNAFSLTLHMVNFTGQAMTCTACHAAQPKFTSTQACVACHGQKDSTFMTDHLSQFGANCMDCHDGRDRMHNFVHAAVFPLDGAHANLACTSCHADQRFKGTPTQCVSCHAEPQIHAGFFGLKCEYCHTAQAWSPAALRIHPFPLDHGGKGEVACQTCHAQTYAQYTCYACHDHQPQEIQQSHAKAGIPAASLTDCVRCHLSGKVEASQP